MRRLLYPILVSLFICTSCTPRQNTITIETYSFDFPPDFKLIEEDGTDSYVGKVKGDGIQLGFDYGYYSDPLVQTPKEYLDQQYWLIDAANRFMKPGIIYDDNNFPKIELISVRPATLKDTGHFKGADFIATCKHDSLIFDYPITLPDKIKQHVVSVDTIQHHLRRIVIAKNPANGLTGIYLRDLKSFNESINGYLALSMAGSHLTKRQQDSLLRIFSSVRFVD